MKNYERYITHLKSSCDYWKRIALAEREKNMKVEEKIKGKEKKIYGLEKEDK